MDLIQDVSKLTAVSQITLNKLANVVSLCICNAVYESVLENEPITEIKLGIGTLLIKYENNEVLYKFIPNQKLENQLIDTIKTNESPLVLELELSLKDKIEAVYKELLI